MSQPAFIPQPPHKRYGRIAFTGSRWGLATGQLAAMERFLADLEDDTFTAVHGACAGGDVQFHEACMDIGVKSFDIWPSNLSKWDKSIDCTNSIDSYNGTPGTVGTIQYNLHIRMDPLKRNDRILGVQAVRPSLLIAGPDFSKEGRTGGTWSTIRKADSIGIPILLLHP